MSKQHSLHCTTDYLTLPHQVSQRCSWCNVPCAQEYLCTPCIGANKSVSIPLSSPVPPVLTAVGNISQTVAQGSTVTFSVSLTNPGLPLANVVWSKDGVPLSNTSNMVVTSTTLQLSSIQVGDRGQYVATATNKAGSVSASFSLFVQCKDYTLACVPANLHEVKIVLFLTVYL